MTEELTYKCRDCGEPFPATQGSRQRFCGKCLRKRISHVGTKRVNAGRPPRKEQES